MKKNTIDCTANIYRGEKLLRILSAFVFFFYFIILIWVVFFKCNIYLSVTNGYHEFKTLTTEERFMYFIVPFEDYFTDNIAFNLMKWKDGALNLLLFVPFGLYCAFFIKNQKFIKTMLISLVTIVTIEIIQLYTLLGSLQTEDLIINLLGTLLGYLLYRLIYKKKNGIVRLTVLNVISIITLIAFAALSIYAIINTTKQFDLYMDIVARKL